jgi:hypothetical protein
VAIDWLNVSADNFSAANSREVRLLIIANCETIHPAWGAKESIITR